MSIETVNRHAYGDRNYPFGMEKKVKSGDEPVASAFARRVRARRKELNLAQGAVAAIAKISQPSLSAIERGETSWEDMKTPTLFGLAKALKLTVEQVAGTAPVGNAQQFAHNNVESYEVSQQTIERVQLLADFDALPSFMKDMLARRASDLRELYEALPDFVRKDFDKEASLDRLKEWEKGIEGHFAVAHKDAIFEEARANLEAAPAIVRKVAETAQKELDKHKTKDGPRWVFVLVPEEK